VTWGTIPKASELRASIATFVEFTAPEVMVAVFG
jgi:hypothetical protein